jgi:signal transduction histidine kinase
LDEARQLTRAGLEEDPSLQVVGEAADGAEAIPRIGESQAEVVVLDLSMPGMDGFEAIPRIRENTPDVGIVVFSALDARTVGQTACSRGADSYVEKGQPFEEVREAVRKARERRAPQASTASDLDLAQFASAASHDLAEPLRVITGFANLLERRYRGQLDEEGEKYIGAILSGTDRMQALIDALRAYSRVDQSELAQEMINCSELVRTVVEGLNGAVEGTGATISFDSLPVVVGEPSLLGDLFQNLLSNALKFRGEEPPEIRVEAERGEGTWSFSVTDNGQGIDPDDAPRAFEMFQRLATRETPGTGIGLAICRRIVERHGGRIWVEPRPRGGSVFRFTLPDPVSPTARPR